MDHETILGAACRKHLELHLHDRVNPDIENFPVAGKPGIRPASIIADPDRRCTVDYPKRLSNVFASHNVFRKKYQADAVTGRLVKIFQPV